MSTRLLVFILAAAILLAAPLSISAKTKPVPGGANAIAGVSGGFNTFLFNGELRFKALDLTQPAAGSLSFPTGQHYLVLHALVKNGLRTSYTNYPPLDATIAGVDGVTYKGANSFGVRPDIDLQPRVTSVDSYLPGAGWKVQIPFLVPDGFVPAKIVIAVPQAKYKAFRITVTSADIK